MEESLDLNLNYLSESEFWIFLFLGVASVLFSILSYIQAKKAKKAANKAGRIVKIQTVTLELSEIIHKLGRLNIDIKFSDAREIYSNINGRLRRYISPYKNEDNYKSVVGDIFEHLNLIQTTLKDNRPTNDNNDQDLNSLYYAIEAQFSSLSGLVSELQGKFEDLSIN